jgi:hypothetical protein
MLCDNCLYGTCVRIHTLCCVYLQSHLCRIDSLANSLANNTLANSRAHRPHEKIQTEFRTIERTDSA